MISLARAFGRRKAALYGSLAGVMIIAGSSFAATSARATSIDQFTTGGSRCGSASSSWAFCLWYSPNMDGGVWGATGNVSTIGATFQNHGDGTGGVGQAVRNNAASAASDENSGCEGGIKIWVYPNYVGAYDSLHNWYGGNLTSDLRNNEASVSILC